MFLEQADERSKSRQVMRWSRVKWAFSLVCAFLIFLTGCKTTKKRDDISGLGMLYQNMTAHYNGYFNATEIMKESEFTLENEHKDNYNQILPVFEYAAIDDPKSVAGNLDEAIKKASVAISLHRPSKWTDDCYLLIGQAQYMKKDYESAQKTLEYMINNFDETGKSKTKTTTKKPSKAKERAEREKKIREKNKEIESRRKEQTKDRKEKSKELEDERKQRVKTRAADKKDREKTRKQEKKEREKANKARKKAREKEIKERKKERKRALKARKKGKPYTKPTTKKSTSETNSSNSDKKTEAPKTKPETKKETSSAEKVEKPEEPKVEKEKKEREPKERKKKEEEEQEITPMDEPKVKDGPLAHPPAYPYGVLWLAKTYVERDFMTQADRMFRKASQTATADKVLLRELYPSMAHFYIYTKNYKEAIPALEQAIETTNRKALKARYSFILGQLHILAGSKGQAVTHFDQSASWSRDYEMAFNARMNSKLAAMSSGSSSQTQVVKELEKMLKDEKNNEFQDQIYFQIAKVFLEANNENKAEEYLKLALDKASSNPRQKTEIHYALGDIYYDKDRFDLAHENYTLAMGSMAKTDARYLSLDSRIADLKEIASHLKELYLQDSLLMLASLSDSELKARAASIIKEREDKMAVAQEKAAAAMAKAIPTSIATSTPIASSNNIPSSFFAYNDKELRKGEREFQKMWGSRPLGDDWRRDETGASVVFDDENEIEISITKQPTSAEVEDVFKDLPRSEEQQNLANEKIADALYNLGMEYRNKLIRLDLSTDAFERFIDEFAIDARVPEAYYFLYLNARDANNLSAAQKYADLLKEKFPDTKYAMIASDPSYINTLLDPKNTVEGVYDATFLAFEAGDYKRVHDAFVTAKERFGSENAYIPKFALLKAMSVGKLQGKDEYIDALRTVVAQYPNTAEQIRAREIIRFLTGDEQAFNKEWDDEILVSNYRVEPDKLHYVIVALYNEDLVPVDNVKIKINDYNNLFHKLDKYSIRSFIINRDTKESAILIRKFYSQSEAMKYHEEVSGRKGEFLPPDCDAEVFAISQYNYREMIKSGGIESYKPFFTEHYLN